MKENKNVSSEIEVAPIQESTRNNNRFIRAVAFGAGTLLLTGCGIEMPVQSSTEHTVSVHDTDEYVSSVAPITDSTSFEAADRATYSHDKKQVRYQGDAVKGLSLRDGRVVLLRSDTYPFVTAEGQTTLTNMPHNTAACYDPSDGKVHSLDTVSPDGSTNQFFKREVSPTERKAHIDSKFQKHSPDSSFGKQWYKKAKHLLESKYRHNTFEWQASSFAVGDKVYAFTSLLESDPERSDAWNFKVIGTKLHVVDLGPSGCDDVTFEKTIDTPSIKEGASGIMWGTSSVYDQKNGYVYVLGNQAVKDPYAGHNYYAARTRLDDVANPDQWQYWNGERFIATAKEQAKPVIPSERGLRDALSLVYDPTDDQYKLTYRDFWPNKSGTATAYEQSGDTVMDALKNVSSRTVLSDHLPADFKGNFSYLPTRQVIIDKDGQANSFVTISVNNVSDPSKQALYGTYSIPEAEALGNK